MDAMTTYIVMTLIWTVTIIQLPVPIAKRFKCSVETSTGCLVVFNTTLAFALATMVA